MVRDHLRKPGHGWEGKWKLDAEGTFGVCQGQVMKF